jgi:hypothetical protein
MPVNDLIILRKGTDSEWDSIDPILASGEPGYDLSNNILKIGDGVNNWSFLPSIGGDIDGSGIANYYSKWVDNNTITSGIIYDDGLNIGIGTTNPYGKLSLSNGYFSNENDSLKSFLIVRNETTNSDETTLFIYGSSGIMTLPVKSVWNFNINLNCYSDTNDGAAGWNFRGVIKRTSNTISLVNSIWEENFIDDNLNGISARVIANTGTNSLDVLVSGLNSNNIRWSAGVDILQTVYDVGGAEPTPTVTPSVTSTATPTVTPSVTSTATPTVTPSVTSTATPTVTPSVTSTATPTPTVTPSKSYYISGLSIDFIP